MDKMTEEIRVDMAPVLIGLVTVNALAQPVAGVVVVMANMTGEGLLFAIRAPAFQFGLGTKDNHVLLERNGRVAEVSLTGRFPILIAAHWALNTLMLVVHDIGTPYSDRRQSEVNTPTTVPPNALYDWIRRRNLSPDTEAFESEAALLGEVTAQLEEMATNIRDSGAWASFWDEERNGNTIVSRRPKREPAVQPLIAALLHHLRTQKNVNVTREEAVGGGDLDFCFTASLRSGRIAQVCVEVKYAHSQRLGHGLRVQLPTYMKTKQTDLGIYVVLEFGKDYEIDLSDVRIPGPVSAELSSGFVLGLAANEVGPNVRIVFLDVSPVVAPSKA